MVQAVNPMEHKQGDVIIVGAGIIGIACAHDLRDAGHRAG